MTYAYHAFQEKLSVITVCSGKQQLEILWGANTFTVLARQAAPVALIVLEAAEAGLKARLAREARAPLKPVAPIEMEIPVVRLEILASTQRTILSWVIFAGQ